MNTKQTPIERLRHHVTGAIERGEKSAIVAVTDSGNAPSACPDCGNERRLYPDGYECATCDTRRHFATFYKSHHSTCTVNNNYRLGCNCHGA